MKNVLIVLALGSLLLTPIEAAQTLPQSTPPQKETKQSERKTLKSSLSWAALGTIAGIYGFTGIDNYVRTWRPSPSELIIPSLASLAAIFCLFKVYDNFPDEQDPSAIKPLLDQIGPAAKKSLHLLKSMGYSVSGLVMGVASLGPVAYGIGGLGLGTSSLFREYELMFSRQSAPANSAQSNTPRMPNPTGAFFGAATAAVAWQYLLPITWNLSKKHWQTAKEEWSKFRHSEQNNVQPSAPTHAV